MRFSFMYEKIKARDGKIKSSKWDNQVSTQMYLSD